MKDFAKMCGASILAIAVLLIMGQGSEFIGPAGNRIQPSAANPFPVQLTGGDSTVFSTTFQKTCPVAPATALPTTSCKRICMRNLDGTNDAFFGASGVLITTGQVLPNSKGGECANLTADADEIFCVAGVASIISVSCYN